MRFAWGGLRELCRNSIAEKKKMESVVFGTYGADIYENV